jgi:predicted acyltransferase
MFVSGALAVTVGLGLNPWIPISRDLWTPSFVLLTAGVSLAAFATFHWLLDLRRYGRWAGPFVILGRNALVLFAVPQLVGTALTGKGLIGVDGRWVSLHEYAYQWFLDGLGDRSVSSLAFALVWLGLCLAGAYLLHRRQWFVRA